MFGSLLRHAFATVIAKTKPVEYARRLGVNVGSGVRIFSLHPGAFGSEPYLVTLEDGVVITAGVRFITHDGSTFIFRGKYPDLDVMGPIHIGRNTFIGSGVTILPGVRVGEGCVIGAMSVVSKNIPDGSVAVGCPAKPIQSTNDFLGRLLAKSSQTGRMTPEDKRRALLSMNATVHSDGRSWLVP